MQTEPTGGNVFDATAATFERDVIERSKDVPVLVDFWAEWCAPCRTLGPVLEKIVNELDGAVLLARVDTEQEQQLAAAFRIQSIPAVKLVHEGRLVDEFTGALPEDQIRRFLAPHLPAPPPDPVVEAIEAAEGVHENGDAAAAETAFREILAGHPDNARATLGLAMALIDLGRPDDARPLLDTVADDDEVGQEARAAVAGLRMAERSVDAGDLDALLARIEADPADLDARMQGGHALAGAGRHREALEQFLEVVDRNPQYNAEAGRTAMLEIFDLVGPRSELAEEFRTRLSRVWFR